MARHEYKELSDNLYARWTTKDEDIPFQLIDTTDEQAPIEIKMTTTAAKELALFLVQYLYEYI